MSFRSLPAEMLGSFILVAAIVPKIFFPTVSEFWLALVTAITLFLIMHIRAQLLLNATAKEKLSS